MKIILQTPRLQLRQFELDDAEALYTLNSDPDVIKHTGNTAYTSLDEAVAFVQNYPEYKKNGYGRWAVVKKSNQACIGWCGLKKNELDLVDLGFRFFKSEWNKGYATESAKASLEYGFSSLQLPQIMARAAKENVASIRVLEKLGMHYWKSDDCNGIHNAHYYRLDNPNA